MGVGLVVEDEAVELIHGGPLGLVGRVIGEVYGDAGQLLGQMFCDASARFIDGGHCIWPWQKIDGRPFTGIPVMDP